MGSNCEQEARLALYKTLPRWKQLPAQEQEAYGARVVRRAAVRGLRRELKHKRCTLSIEDLSERDQRSIEPLYEEKGSDDYLIIWLGVVMDFSDAEVASALHISPSAAKKRRQRALAKMRVLIEKAGRGGVITYLWQECPLLEAWVP